MPVGRWYTDGSFHGPFPLMASSMELEKDRPFDALVQVVIPTIKTRVRDGRPAPAAAAVSVRDRPGARGARARAVLLERRSAARSCHGDVRRQAATSDWPGVHADVGTDRSRLDVVSDGFIDAFNRSPLAAGRRAREEPRLRGDAADRRLGELSVPPQRQRADALPSARPGVGAAEDLSR